VYSFAVLCEQDKTSRGLGCNTGRRHRILFLIWIYCRNYAIKVCTSQFWWLSIWIRQSPAQIWSVFSTYTVVHESMRHICPCLLAESLQIRDCTLDYVHRNDAWESQKHKRLVVNAGSTMCPYVSKFYILE